MSVEQRLMLSGQWSLRLKPDTPQAIMAVLALETAAFGHVIITPSRVDDPAATSATLMSVASYTGVYRRRPSQWEIGGPGLAFWLGDEDGKGDVLESALTKAAGTFVQWVTDLRPSSLDAGTYSAIAGTLNHSFQYVDRRTALNYVCDYFGGEWKIDPTGTLHAGQDADLFTTTPTVVVQRRSGGADLAITGLRADLDTDRDFEDYTTRVFLVAHGTGTTTGSANISPATAFKDLNGNAVDLTRIVESSDTKPGNENTVAQAQLNRFTSPREAIPLSIEHENASHEVISDSAVARLQVGDYIYVYDTELGLYDTGNEVEYRGQTIHPAIQRVMGATWPVSAGMGVYFRAPDAGGTVTDLTDWIVFEDGAATIDVGANPRSGTGSGTGPAVLERSATSGLFEQFFRRSATDTYLSQPEGVIHESTDGFGFEVRAGTFSGSSPTGDAQAVALWTDPDQETTNLKLQSELSSDLFSVELVTGNGSQHGVYVTGPSLYADLAFNSGDAYLDLLRGAVTFTIVLDAAGVHINSGDADWCIGGSATPGATATVTGSRGGNAALASLLTALAAKGIIVDGSS